MKTSVKSKKIALLSAGALLSLGIAATAGGLTASAAEITQGSASGTTTVTLPETPETWTVSIPDSITVGGDSVPTNVIKATAAKLQEGHKLVVKVESENEWKLGGWDYQLDIGGTKYSTDGATVFEVASSDWSDAGFASTGKSSAEVKAELKDAHSQYANAQQTDSLTFTVESVAE